MKGKLENFGLVIDKVGDPDAYILGGSVTLPKVVLQADRNWQPFNPTYEPQFNDSYDTSGCTVWGTQNIAEFLLKRLEGKEYNFAERFNYILAKIRPPGADPHAVAEEIRKDGLIPHELLPMTSTFEEFVRPYPMTARYLVEGHRFPYIMKSEYVWRTPQTREQRMAKIREYLQYSPLGVSVTAWFEEGGVYVDNGLPNTHWCVLTRETDRGWLIFDSYDQHEKILSFDHDIQVCKWYALLKKTSKDNWLVELTKNIFGLFKDLIKGVDNI